MTTTKTKKALDKAIEEIKSGKKAKNGKKNSRTKMEKPAADPLEAQIENSEQENADEEEMVEPEPMETPAWETMETQTPEPVSVPDPEPEPKSKDEPKPCPFLDRIVGAQALGKFKNGVQQIQRSAKVETSSGTIAIQVTMYAVEFDNEINEFPTKREAIQWLSASRKAAKGGVSTAKVARFTKRVNAIVKKLEALDDASADDASVDDEIKSCVVSALQNMNHVLYVLG